MKISDFDDEGILKYLKITDFENFFTVHQDLNGKYFYNLNETLYFNADKASLSKYVCTHRMHWPLISYKLYGTTRLAWLLYKLNDVTALNIFDIKEPGDIIYYLDLQYIESIVADLNDFDLK